MCVCVCVRVCVRGLCWFEHWGPDCGVLLTAAAMSLLALGRVDIAPDGCERHFGIRKLARSIILDRKAAPHALFALRRAHGMYCSKRTSDSCGDYAGGMMMPIHNCCRACFAESGAKSAPVTEDSQLLDHIFSYLELRDWGVAARAGIVALNPERMAVLRHQDVKKVSRQQANRLGQYRRFVNQQRVPPYLGAIGCTSKGAGKSWLVGITGAHESYLDVMD